MGDVFEFSIDDTTESFVVVDFHGKERLNKPYSFEVTLVGKPIRTAVAETRILGQLAHLKLTRDEHETERWVHGVVLSFEREGISGHHPDKHHYRARLVPAFRLLGEGRQSRIFQDRAVPDIVSEVLMAGGVRHAWRLAATYKPRTYCVQYRESDRRFVERLLREEGLFYWFEQPAGNDESEILVIADAPSASPSVDGQEKLTFRDSSGMTEQAEDVRRFRLTHRVEPSRVLLRDFDFLRPSFDVSARAQHQAESGQRISDVMDSLPGASDVSAFAARGQRAVREGQQLASDVRAVADDPQRALREAARRARRATIERLRSAASQAGPREPRDLLSAAEGALGRHEIREPADVLSPDEIEQYDHHGELEGGRVDAPLARTHLEQHRRRGLLGRGESRDVFLLPGRRFALVGCPIETDDGDYVVVEVEHEGHNPLASRTGLGEGAREIYKNTFVCIPAHIPFRPKRPRRNPQQVMETATVVGPAGAEIHTDSLGRIKVHFHWDRQGASSENASCWMRVATSWAGTGFGTQFIPRVGMEVVVGFLAGDMDRPLVMGAVYNAEHPVPFGLPGEKTKSGIRTNSSRGGGGYNELSFEDRKNYERVHLRAQKDLDILVRNNETRRVELHQTTNVGANQYSVVGGNRIDLVAGDANDVIGLSSRERVGADRETNIGASDTLHVKKDRTEEIGQDAIRNVSKHALDNIGASAAINVGHSYTLRAGSHLTMVVASAEHPGATALHTFGQTNVNSSGFLEIESGRGIILKCGTSSIVVLPDHIEIHAEEVGLYGADARVTLSDGRVSIISTDTATVGSNEIVIAGQAASVKLTSEATIKGTKVKLGGNDSSSDDAPSESTTPTKIKLEDREGNPLPHQRYVIRLPDGTERAGALDENGRAELSIDEAGQAQIHFPEAVGEGGSTARSMRPHVVRPGEYLTELAFRRGFDASALWNAPENRELRERRPDPEMLLPGDVVHLPDEPPPPEALRLKSENTFVVDVPMAETTVRLVDDAGRALAGEAYRIEGLPGQPMTGSADGDGNVHIRLPVTVRSVRLVLPRRGSQLDVMMGHLDPIEHDSGVRQRLESLGLVGIRPGAEDIAHALRRFQQQEEIEVTGEINAATRERLRERHGS